MMVFILKSATQIAVSSLSAFIRISVSTAAPFIPAVTVIFASSLFIFSVALLINEINAEKEIAE